MTPGKRADQLWTREHLAELEKETFRLEDDLAILRQVGRRTAVLALAYWPRSEIDHAMVRFPQACADLSAVDDPHLLHRRTVESALRAAEGSRELTVVPLTVE
ncbi:hypothetical protein [Amycolatopsis alkalitolerans]|uniref:Uncharacterized protein n=1 Tax=Amycolatopsis alkalitolerans TaxID=2547244 RepID=A0A5C4M4R7_9PSEU|nr:hypothetical protein [Amycolatopsis alkalitolerans]TNC26405.1 hypothetical protein FG385_11650 [Amycolatopsis alkalitolerans]